MTEGPVKRLHHVSFTISGSDEVLASLERHGTPVIEPPAGTDESGIWLRDPDGTAVQLTKDQSLMQRLVEAGDEVGVVQVGLTYELGRWVEEGLFFPVDGDLGFVFVGGGRGCGGWMRFWSGGLGLRLLFLFFVLGFGHGGAPSGY